MKTYLAGLQASLQTSYANNGKTTMLGRAFQKTLNSQSVIGPALTNFIDVFTTVGITPSLIDYDPNTGRLFVLSAASATPTVALFNFNSSSGVYSYVGKVILSLSNAAATTHSFRGFAVNDTGVTFQIILASTGSVVVNGGIFVAYAPLSSFTIGGTTLYSASGAGQNAVYLLQPSDYYGVNNTAANGSSATWGVDHAFWSSNSAYNTKIYALNNTIAVPQVLSFDLAGTPAVAGTILNGVSAQTTLYAGTSPSAFFTMGASTNGYSLTAGDPVVLMTGTGAVPTAFTAWTAGTAQTAAVNVYFVRDLQLVSGNYYFNLSSTTGGAAITPTSSTSSFTMMRAFGTCTNLFYGRTPVAGFAPALTGTIIQADGVTYAKPTSAPLNTGLNGQDCLSFPTNSTLYLGKIADLFIPLTGTLNGTTSVTGLSSTASLTTGMAVVGPSIPAGATISLINTSTSITLSIAATTSGSAALIFGANNWASLSGANILGTGVDIVAPALVTSRYDNYGLPTDVDKFIYLTNTSSFVMKSLQNSNITAWFGGLTINYYEAQNPATVQLGLTAVGGMEFRGGWFFLTGTGTGQRGAIFADAASDAMFGQTAVISPVLTVPAGTILKYIDTLEQLFDSTDYLLFWVRSAATTGDALFSSANIPTPSNANGWTAIKTAVDLSPLALGPAFQFCVTFEILTLVANTPAQINDLQYTVVPTNEMSDNWEGSVDNTSSGGASPAYTSFRLQTAYATSVPTMYFRAYDDSGNLVASANTASNPTMFQYTTNNGTSWNALGTVPNTPLTTELRYAWTSPPGVRVTCSIRES